MSYHNVVRNIVCVKAMGRISRCQHDIVCNIYQSVDGAHACLPDPVLHLVGRGLYSHAGHFHADVSGTPVRIVDLYLEIRLYIRCIGLDLLQGQIIQRRDLTGDSVMSPQVRTVRHGLVIDFQQNVVHIQSIRQRCSCRNLKSRQVENLCLLICREQVAQANLTGSADHAIGLHPAELGVFNHHRLALSVPAHYRAGAGHSHTHALLQVDSSADDILDLTAADIYLAYLKLIRVGMGLDFRNDTHKHIVKPACQIFHILHLYGRHGQIIGQFFQIHILRDLYIILYP